MAVEISVEDGSCEVSFWPTSGWETSMFVSHVVWDSLLSGGEFPRAVAKTVLVDGLVA